jgi:hypothetical protein
MTSELSIFAERLRDFIAIVAEETPLAAGENDPARQHYDAEFNGMAMVLFELQFQYNPAYRQICEARKIFPVNATHWTHIPAVPASAFKELELTCLPPGERTAVFHSSGTTAQRPSRHFHSAESLVVYEASLWTSFRERMIQSGAAAQPVLLTPPEKQAPHSSLVHMFEIIRRETGAPDSAFTGAVGSDGGWTVNFDAVRAAFDKAVKENCPVLLLGTAFSFVHLLDFLEERNLRFDLPAGSRVMETGGYKGRSRAIPKTELHSLITKRFGVSAAQIVCEYGMSELSSQAYDAEVRDEKGEARGSERIFRLPLWARFQVVSPETGKEVAEGATGLLRIFDLANVYSVLAIQTEDLAVRRGDGFELLGRAERSEPRGCSLMPGENSGDRPGKIQPDATLRQK